MVHDPDRERTHRPQQEGKVVVRPDDRPPGDELKAAFKRLWRDDRPRVAIPRDIVVVLIALMVVLGGFWAYTGQPFPERSPLVVVESGSMMHPDPAYGRVGTIDPGDLVLVKRVDGPDEVRTAYQPDERTGYGGMGDVIIYRPHGRSDATPIIHRALTWVEVAEVPVGDGEMEKRYAYHDERGELLVDQTSVTLPTAGIMGRQFPKSGFVTKGDNPATNAVADQISHTRDRLIEDDWVIGKARGEIPWIGLIKLALAGNPKPGDTDGHCPFLRAWAPCDTWIMLALSVGALVLVPIALERVYRASPRLRRLFD